METALHHISRLSTSEYSYHNYSPRHNSQSIIQDYVSHPNPIILQQYLSYYSEPLTPLDLSIKTSAHITPPCTPSPLQKVAKYSLNNYNDSNENDKIIVNLEKVIESRPSRTSRAIRHNIITDEESSNESSSPEAKKLKFSKKFFDDLKSCLPVPNNDELITIIRDERSPNITILDVDERPKKNPPKAPLHKKSKAVRKLTFDEDKTSPVSGTIIKDLDDDESLVVRKGDIDPAFNVVEITAEAKASLAGIENRLGRYICRLCRKLYEDAFALAQHRCERIVHIEYRCPECDKVFNCPANLASHRRWHKPRPNGSNKHKIKLPAPNVVDVEHRPDITGESEKYTCEICGKIFRRQAYLRKHYNAHEIQQSKTLPTIPYGTTYNHQQLNSETNDSTDHNFSLRHLFTKNSRENDELSAFKQVFGKPNDNCDKSDTSNPKNFWSASSFDEDADREVRYPTHHRNNAFLIDQNDITNKDIGKNYPSSIISSVLDEDSQTLDITGSEDEGDNDKDALTYSQKIANIGSPRVTTMMDIDDSSYN